MFDVGFTELVLLALVGLLVLGPERLPKVARTAGALMRKARSSWTSLRQTIDQELATQEIRESMEKAKQEFQDTADNISGEIKDNIDEIKESITPGNNTNDPLDKESSP